MLPVPSAHREALFARVPARLQTTLALLSACLWWATPPDKLFHPPRPIITSSQPQPCHNSSPHTFQSGYAVSFTPNPAPEWQTGSDFCDSLMSRWPFYALFSQLWLSYVCHQRASTPNAPERYDSRLRVFFDGAGTWKHGCHPRCSSPQGDIESLAVGWIPNKIVSVLPVKTD